MLILADADQQQLALSFIDKAGASEQRHVQAGELCGLWPLAEQLLGRRWCPRRRRRTVDRRAEPRISGKGPSKNLLDAHGSRD